MSDLFIKHVHWYLSYNIRSIVATGLDRSDPQDKLWYSDKCDLYKPDLQIKIKRELWISPKLLKCQVLTTWMKVGHQVCCCGGDARNKIQYKNFKILIMIFFCVRSLFHSLWNIIRYKVHSEDHLLLAHEWRGVEWTLWTQKELGNV